MHIYESIRGPRDEFTHMHAWMCASILIHRTRMYMAPYLVQIRTCFYTEKVSSINGKVSHKGKSPFLWEVKCMMLAWRCTHTHGQCAYIHACMCAFHKNRIWLTCMLQCYTDVRLLACRQQILKKKVSYTLSPFPSEKLMTGTFSSRATSTLASAPATIRQKTKYKAMRFV